MQILCKYWANILKILGKHWLIIGQMLGKCWENIGQILEKYWANIGKILGKYWAHIWHKLDNSSWLSWKNLKKSLWVTEWLSENMTSTGCFLMILGKFLLTNHSRMHCMSWERYHYLSEAGPFCYLVLNIFCGIKYKCGKESENWYLLLEIHWNTGNFNH